MKILLLDGNGTDASNFYRGAGPYKRLDGVEIIQTKEVNWNVLLGIDVVVCLRPSNTNMVGILEYVKLCKKPIIIDYDDSHLTITESNPAYDKLMNPVAQACWRKCIELADVVTVSTKAIKDEIIEIFPDKEVVVIPNAADDYLFDLTPSYHKRNKTILIRGGGSHEQDIESYKDTILELIKEYPEYKWCFMGYCPKWVTESGISDDRLLVYQYTDMMKYFDTLMELKPEIMIVPLENNAFNKAKSNIAWQEGTLAGTAVIAPVYLKEFCSVGAYQHVDNDFIESFKDLKDGPYPDGHSLSMYFYEQSLMNIPRLSKTNEQRKEILYQLLHKKRKFLINSPERKVATDKEFYESCLIHGCTQENPNYEKLHRGVVDWLVKKLDPKTVVEFGSGPGATIEYFHEYGIPANGLEINPLLAEYFNKRNPHLTEYYHLCDFVNEKLDIGKFVIDLGISIEVFEHIDMEEEKWNSFILDLSKNYKHFYFSSTPFRDKPSFDYFWGHKNIRTPKSWIKLFEDNGWTLVENPKKCTGWDLLFISKNS